MNFNMIAYILGNIIRIEAALLAVPAFISIWYQETKAASAFVVTITACLMVGTVLASREPENKRIYGREGFVVVALSWIVMSVLGALPFYLSGSISGYINCLFETVSGFTTTGASILQEIETLPKSIQFWRCFTHWIGGMGILVFMLAIMPLGDAECAAFRCFRPIIRKKSVGSGFSVRCSVRSGRYFRRHKITGITEKSV